MKISKMLLEHFLSINKQENLSLRHTGKSTGRALVLIGMAMQSPENPIKLEEPGQQYQGHLIDLVVDLIKKLELKYFYVNKFKGTLLYDPFVVLTTNSVEKECNGR